MTWNEMTSPIEYYHCDYIEFFFPQREKNSKVTYISSIPTPEYKDKYKEQCKEYIQNM